MFRLPHPASRIPNRLICAIICLVISGHAVAQNPILRTTTAVAPTSLSQVVPSVIVQSGPRIGIGTNSASQLLTLQKTASPAAQGDTWSEVPPAMRFEFRNLANTWRYWHVVGGETFKIANIGNSNVPMEISLGGTVDFMENINVNVQGITGANSNKLGLSVNNTVRRIYWSSYTSLFGNNLTTPFEFFYDAQGTGGVDVSVMTMLPGGQVRIGPKNTLYENYTLNSIQNNNNSIRLTVKGGIVASRFIATTQNWADWVFYESWRNPTLEEEKASIEANCTLVGVPSENDVRNGMDLAETNAILLSKIEQNYLHDIEQQEIIKLLLQRIEKLESEITVRTNHK